MNSIILFSEKQRFKQWWFWLILLGVNGLFLFGVIQQVILGHPFGDKPIGNTGILIAFGGTLALSLMLFFTKLETQLTQEGIAVRLFPFHLKFKRFNWSDLEKAYVRQYSPIVDYGGWGLRYSLSGKGKAHNISGNMGLQLQFKNGKKLLIGTRKPEELKEVLDQLEIEKSKT